MVLKFKRLVPNAVIPSHAKYGDAGYDLFATAVGHNSDFIEYFTGLAMEIPKDYVGLIFPRSSLSKYDLDLANSVGVIDSGYRGEISVRFRILDAWKPGSRQVYKVGDRIAQLVILSLPDISVKEVQELSPSERGSDGYGSTGN